MKLAHRFDYLNSMNSTLKCYYNYVKSLFHPIIHKVVNGVIAEAVKNIKAKTELAARAGSSRLKLANCSVAAKVVIVYSSIQTRTGTFQMNSFRTSLAQLSGLLASLTTGYSITIIKAIKNKLPAFKKKALEVMPKSSALAKGLSSVRSYPSKAYSNKFGNKSHLNNDFKNSTNNSGISRFIIGSSAIYYIALINIQIEPTLPPLYPGMNSSISGSSSIS